MAMQIVDIVMYDKTPAVIVSDGQNSKPMPIIDIARVMGSLQPLKCTCLNKIYDGYVIKGYVLGNFVTQRQMQLPHDVVKELLGKKIIKADNLKVTSDGRVISFNPDNVKQEETTKPAPNTIVVTVVGIIRASKSIFGVTIKSDSGTQKNLTFEEAVRIKNNKKFKLNPLICKCTGKQTGEGIAITGYSFITQSGDNFELTYEAAKKFMLHGLISCINATLASTPNGYVIRIR